MLKRFINNIQDQAKKDASPSSPAKSSSETQGAEGFLCPTCMLALPSAESLQVHYESTHIDGAATSVDPDEKNTLICPACKMRFSSEHFLQSHYNRHHAGEIQAKTNDMQTLKMEVAELKTSLQEEKWHSDELKKEVDRLQSSVMGNMNENSDDFLAEMEMMRQQNKALEESKSLLTSEILLLRQQLTDSYNTNKDIKEEHEKIKLRSATMFAESADVKSKLDEETDNKLTLERHIHELQNEVVDLNSKLDQRPSADDVLVLKQELVSVQTLMDQMTQKKEAEKSKLEVELSNINQQFEQSKKENDELMKQLQCAPQQKDIDKLKEIINQGSSGSEKLQQCLHETETELSNSKLAFQKKEQEFNELQENFEKQQQTTKKYESLAQERLNSNEDLDAKLNVAQGQLSDLNCSVTEKQDKIMTLEAQIDDLEINLKQCRDNSQSAYVEKEQSFNHLKMEMERVHRLLKEKESQVEDLSKELTTVQKHYQEATSLTDDYKSQLREKERHVEEQERLKNETSEKIAELNKELSERKENVDRLEAERTDLLAKIEAGEGANTAMQQLNQKNKDLQDKVAELLKSSEESNQQHSTQRENFHKQIQQLKTELEAQTDTKEKLENEVKEHVVKMKNQQERITMLDADIKAKAQLILAAEESKATLRVDLENHLTSTKNMLLDKTKELEKITERLEQVQTELSNKKEENGVLKNQSNELNEKVRHLENKLSTSETTLAEKSEALIAATTSVSEMKANLKDKSENIRKLETTVSELKENQKAVSASAQEAKQNLEMQLNQLTDAKLSLTEQLTNLTSDLKSAKKDTVMLQESLNEKLGLHAKEKEELIASKNAIEATFQNEKSELKTKISSMEKDAQDFQKLLEDKKIEHERLKVKFNLIDSDVNNLTAKINTQEVEMKEKTEKLNELQSKHDKLATDHDQLLSKHSEIKSQLQDTEEARQSLNEEKESLDQEVVQLRLKFEKETTELEKQQLAFGQVQAMNIDLEEKLKKANENIMENAENEEQLNLAINDLTSVKVDMSASLLKQEEELKEIKSKFDEVSNAKNKLQVELDEKNMNYDEIQDKHSSSLKELSDITEQFKSFKKESSEEISNLKTAKELLLNQKVQYQNQIKELQSNLDEKMDKMSIFQENWSKEKSMFMTEAEEMKARLTEEIKSHREIKQQKEENDTKYEMQLGALTENLSTLRADLVVEQEKNEEVEKRVDELTGDKLELEAKLENALDERRALLERCLSSETECEKLRSTTSELRKKYDDSLAAMHELGRENQTLQIETQKYLNQKWAEDSEVTACSQCSKGFSVTVRKHHCRKCGKIFCNECSSKQATVASSKKPVRVCEPCYREVTNH